MVFSIDTFKDLNGTLDFLFSFVEFPLLSIHFAERDQRSGVVGMPLAESGQEVSTRLIELFICQIIIAGFVMNGAEE